MLENLGQDLRISLRSLLRAPLLTLTIVATVGLGLGATATIFGAIDAALLRPLPYKDPERLVRIYTDSPPNRFRFSVVDCLALETQQTQFEAVAAYTDRAAAFSDGTVAERLRGREVSWPYFSLLGIVPALGRDFAAEDGRPGAPPAVIVSHGFWQRRLGGRPDLLGSPLRLDGRDYTLVGVLPRQTGPLEEDREFFVPAQWETPRRKGPFLWTEIGRLRAGVDRAAVTAELRAINRGLFPLWRASYQDERATWSLMDLKAHVSGEVGTVAGVALAAVGLVWLIACANASNLLTARVASRRRELAVRAALGATRARVLRHLLAESSLLALGAAILGAVLAWAGVRALQTFGAGYFPRLQEIAVGGPVLWLLAALAASSVLLCGMVPALQGTGGPVDDALRSGGRAATGGVGVRRVRRLLVGGQFAIATPLLIAAALQLATLNALGRTDPGFDTRQLLTGSVSLPDPQYPEPGTIASFWSALQERLAGQPEVAGVAFSDSRPPNEADNFNNFDLEDAPAGPGRPQHVTPWISVTPEYFHVLGVRLLEGRLLDESDQLKPDVEAIVVDEAWAKRFFPQGSAVGRRLHEGGCTSCPWTTVVGVVSGVKYAGLSQPEEGTVYWAMPKDARTRFLVLRTRVSAAAAAPAVLRTVRALDPSLPVSAIASADDLVARSLQRPRSLSWLVGVFAAVALALSTIGIYGVMAHYVQQHLREVGIRLALGATRPGVLRRVVGQGMAVVAGGVGIGLLAGLLLTRWMSSLLFGVGATDPLTFAAVGALLFAVASVACFVPARRAVALPLVEVLRED